MKIVLTNAFHQTAVEVDVPQDIARLSQLSIYLWLHARVINADEQVVNDAIHRITIIDKALCKGDENCRCGIVDRRDPMFVNEIIH